MGVTGPEAELSAESQGAASRGAEVRLVDVERSYRTAGGVVIRALSQVCLEIPAGQSVAVKGRSGSGKSTLLHLVGAMDVADCGSVLVAERDLGALSARDRTAYRRSVGMVFQRFHLLPALTVWDNVAAPVVPFATPFDKRARARELIAAVGLRGREHDLPSRLSGGEQQRVAVARALIGDPVLLLADEPTGNLDSAVGAQVLDLLFGVHAARQMTMLVATHDPIVAARCERVVELSDGRVVGDRSA
ncbi:MAG TPA: ABC transporter ATP-binding protein [Acidimicrobiales bacterium]|nr:ABC transporter ATP-binding protein [Acidimicrobiales bacterium]